MLKACDKPSPRAFVIDDEGGICTFMTAALASLGVSATSYPSADLALEALDRGHPQFIFLDIALKGSDAIDVIRTLGEQHYRGVVQLMSGSDVHLLEEVRRVGMRHGLNMRAPLTKPMRVGAIGDAIREVPGGDQPAVARAAGPAVALSLDEALAEAWLELWYQPKIDLRTGALAGVEALIRCRHPQHGVLTPANFLPGASQQSMVDLTRYVVMSALQDAGEMLEAGAPLRVAVNTSVGALTRLPIAKLVRQHRPARAGWPGLILEVTESEVVNDVDLVHEIATQLRIYGIELAIDDFGEGHSSFARLRELPFSELKLDRSFVDGCAQDQTNRGICRAVVELAHHFGVAAVAEGVESAADLQVLMQMGCDVGQGYLFARPMPKRDLTALVCERARSGQSWLA